jgi:hypothetical protein
MYYAYIKFKIGIRYQNGLVSVISWRSVLLVMVYLHLPASNTTHVVSSNPAHGEVHWIQHYAIKYVSDLRQIGGFLWVLWFHPPIELTSTI